MNLTAKILKALNIEPILQISNINIPKLVASELNVDIDLFKNGEIASLFKLNCDWLNKLIKVKDTAGLAEVIKIVPEAIKDELEKLLQKANEVEYTNIIIAPLYYGSLRYYNGIYYRVINDNLTLCKGGMYSSEGMSSLGFALYTDNLLKILED